MEKKYFVFLATFLFQLGFSQNLLMIYETENKKFDSTYDETIKMAKVDGEKAFKMVKQLKILSEAQNSALVKSKFYLAMSNVSRINGNYELAEEYLNSAKNEVKDNSKISSYFLFYEYLLAEDRQNIQKASDCLFKLLKYYEATKNTYGQARIMSEIGVFYTRTLNSEKSKKFLREAYALAQNTKNRELVFITSMYNSYSTEDLQELEKIKKENINYLQEIKRNPTYRLLIDRYYSTISYLDMKTGNFPESIKYIDSALATNKGAYEQMYYSSYKAFALMQMKKYKEVEELYLNSIKSGQSSKNYAFEEETRNYLMNFYLDTQQKDKAYEQLMRINSLNDSIKLKEKRIFATEMEFKYDNDKKEAQILYYKKNSLLQKIIFGGILLTGILFFFFRRHHEKKIYQKELELGLLNNKLEITKLERNRISQEIHDDLGSNITAISLASYMMNSNDLVNETKELKIITKNIEKISVKTKEIIWSLNTDNDTLGNLIAFVRKQLREFAEVTTIQFEIAENVSKQSDVYLEAFVRKKLYLSIKEIINNAVKYSEAKVVELFFDYSDRTLSIIINDDGVGFDMENVQKGNGLHNIKRNIEEIGGHVNLTSKKDFGTKVEVQINI